MQRSGMQKLWLEHAAYSEAECKKLRLENEDTAVGIIRDCSGNHRELQWNHEELQWNEQKRE